MNNKIYNTVLTQDLSKIDFTEVEETSKDTIRKSLDKSQFVIKYNTEPSFITDGTLTPLGTYNYSEILEILSGSDWTEPMPEE